MLNMNIADISSYSDNLIDVEVSISSQQAQSFLELYLQTHGFPNVKAADIIPSITIEYDYEDASAIFNGFTFKTKMKLGEIK